MSELIFAPLHVPTRFLFFSFRGKIDITAVNEGLRNPRPSINVDLTQNILVSPDWTYVSKVEASSEYSTNFKTNQKVANLDAAPKQEWKERKKE